MTYFDLYRSMGIPTAMISPISAPSVIPTLYAPTAMSANSQRVCVYIYLYLDRKLFSKEEIIER